MHSQNTNQLFKDKDFAIRTKRQRKSKMLSNVMRAAWYISKTENKDVRECLHSAWEVFKHKNLLAIMFEPFSQSFLEPGEQLSISS